MLSQEKKVIICAGGTGGHVFPAKKLAELLLAKGVNIEWIGSSRGPEENICKNLGINFYKYPMIGFRGKSNFKKLISLTFLFLSLIKFLIQFQLPNLFSKNNILICFGGYISLLGLSHFSGPIFIQEQNTIPGSTNRLLARLKNIQKIFCGFPETVKFFNSEKAIFTGNLINLDPGKIKNSSRELDELRIKIIGGSQGARIINETMPRLFKDMLESFPKLKLKITHQCGREKKTEIQSVYNSLKGNIDFEIHEFIDEMEYFYSHADLIVSRAGALSVSEICASKNIAIFIPLANSIDNHQYENAKFLVNKNSAFICEEKNIRKSLNDLIVKIINKPNLIDDMRNKILKISLSDENELILKSILNND